MPDFIHIHTKDNVAVALKAIPAGTAFAGITAVADIPQGHKMALKPIAEGDQIMIKVSYIDGFAHKENQVKPNTTLYFVAD